MSEPAAFPLQWPEGFPRSAARETGSFRTKLPVALENVRVSLKAFSSDSRKAVSGIVLSSNVSIGVDKPEDPGVAAWFSWDGLHLCIPVDRYKTPAANLQAIHHILEARRVELRHGSLALIRATLKGFLALPAPDWRRVLDLPSGPVSKDQVLARHKLAALAAHPDRGGTHEAMAEINRARDAALKEIGT